MDAVIELIKMGFNFTVVDNQISYKVNSNKPINMSKANKLFAIIKANKQNVIGFLNSKIEYEIPEGLNFEYQVQACLQAARDNNINWYRADIYPNKRKIVLIGAIRKPELLQEWLQDEKESHYYNECPFIINSS